MCSLVNVVVCPILFGVAHRMEAVPTQGSTIASACARATAPSAALRLLREHLLPELGEVGVAGWGSVKTRPARASRLVPSTHTLALSSQATKASPPSMCQQQQSPELVNIILCLRAPPPPPPQHQATGAKQCPGFKHSESALGHLPTMLSWLVPLGTGHSEWRSSRRWARRQGRLQDDLTALKIGF